MNKVLRLFVAGAVSASALCASAYSFEKDGVYYNITSDNTVEVTFRDKNNNLYGTYSGDLVIPQTVENEGTTYTVTAIGANAVRKCFDNLKSVTMPATITTIGSAAFSECTAITTITLPDQLEKIDNYAFNSCARLAEIKWGSSLKTTGSGVFMYCWSLTDVALPEGLVTVGQNLFQNCFNLKTVSIPASATELKQSPFRDCSHIVAITVAEGNPNYSSADGILYNKDKTELIQYNGGRNATSFTIPDGVKTLAYYSFAADSTLTDVTISASVETIYNTAFYKSPKLENVTIGKSVKLIGKQAFLGTALKSVVVPDAVTEIQDQAFSTCDNLETVTLGTGVTTLGNKAFEKAPNVKRVTVNAAVPPTCGKVLFEDAVYTAASLYVPTASVEAYKAAEMWSNFTNISAAGTSGIDGIADSAAATPVLYIQPSGYVSAAPAQGLNIVKMSDGTVRKILVK